MMLWLYMRLIGPMITYSSVVQWTKTQQEEAIRRLSGMQRQACLCATGGMRTTPIAALEVVLTLDLLHIYIDGKTKTSKSLSLNQTTPVLQAEIVVMLGCIKELRRQELPIYCYLLRQLSTGLPTDEVKTAVGLHEYSQ
ncbi:hypothetical protein Trydic_g1380 [Trypoxylus dichotomus]